MWGGWSASQFGFATPRFSQYSSAKKKKNIKCAVAFIQGVFYELVVEMMVKNLKAHHFLYKVVAYVYFL